jgi:hypothetical protein
MNAQWQVRDAQAKLEQETSRLQDARAEQQALLGRCSGAEAELSAVTCAIADTCRRTAHLSHSVTSASSAQPSLAEVYCPLSAEACQATSSSSTG